jgi:hypothetical protein
MVRSLLFALFVTLALFGVRSSAGAASENFDGFTGVLWSGGVVEPGAQVSDDLVSLNGAVFSTQGGSDFAAAVDLITNFPRLHAPSPPNGVAGASLAGILTYELPIKIAFFDPSNPNLPATTNSVSIQGDLVGNGGTNFASLEAYDLNGVLLVAESKFDNTAGGPGVLTVSGAGIHFVLARSDDGTVAFDNLQFNEVAPVPQPLPTLTGPALVLLVLGILGAYSIVVSRRSLPVGPGQG